ncbi:MAG: ATP-binding cassette domain-containing protein [Eubacterium sp.]|nr:ATP-binding cassette domain-containing protein [Eubacterium sp.]
MVLQAEHVGKAFTDGGVSDVSLAVKPGTFTVISGESGIGKTTLLNILSGMLHPDEGKVYVKNAPDEKEIYSDMKRKERITLLAKNIGYMMQGVSMIPSLTVHDNITYPLKLIGCKYEEKDLDEILKTLGIEGIRDSYPGRISGGEYRRALLAGVLLKKPDIIIADEPTSSLDSETAAVVREVLKDYVSDKTAVVVATHDAGFTGEDERIELR